jgi:exopolysaccharide biosynthesis polyprenyl glycosylphosphotransferase
VEHPSVRDMSLSQPAYTIPDLSPEDPGQPRRSSRRDNTSRITLAAADVTAVLGALFVISLLTESDIRWMVFPLLPVFILMAKMGGLYDRDQHVLHKTTLDEGSRLVSVAAIYALVVEGLRGVDFVGRSQPFLLWGALTIGLIITRAMSRFLVARLTPPERLLVIGDAEAAMLVERKLAFDPALNAAVVGRMDMVDAPGGDGPVELLGDVSDLQRVLDEHGIERVIVAPSHEGGEDVVDLIRVVKACGVKVAVLPRLLEVIGSSVEFDDLSGQALLSTRGFGLSTSSRILKRALDLSVAGGAVLLLSPILLVIAVLVKLSSPGPVLFRQGRIGRHGDEFEMLKFRTMVRDADERKHELLERNEAAPLFKIADDPRVTRVGRFLRRYSFDEIPQLFNVLRGDMSIVGPRPLVPAEDRLFSGWQRRRNNVSPGVTGPWQILGSSRVPVEDMVTLDYLYCANWSLWLDLKIILRTVPYILSRRSPEFAAPDAPR